MTEEMGLQTFSKKKTDIDDADVTFSGRVFQSRAVATGKAWSQMVENGCVGQQAMMSMQSEYADEPHQQMMMEFLCEIQQSCVV